MICLEPAIALTYREEYPKYSSHEAKFSVSLISEFLSSNEAQLRKTSKRSFIFYRTAVKSLHFQLVQQIGKEYSPNTT